MSLGEIDLEELLREPIATASFDPTVCARCNSRTEESGNSLVCSGCGHIVGCADQLGEQEKATPAVVQVGTRTYNIGHSSVESRKLEIQNSLRRMMEAYMQTNSVQPVPMSVINCAAGRYAEIQQKLMERGESFIHRGGVRRKILAAIIADELIVQNCSRKKDVIAGMLDLQENGFADGQKILRKLANKQIIILSDHEDMKGFAERYLSRLDLNTPENVEFVERVVQISNECNIKMECQRSSKVVGAIWLLIKSLRSNITIAQVESASENTRENTFKGFYKELVDNIGFFIEIYRDLDMDVPLA